MKVYIQQPHDPVKVNIEIDSDEGDEGLEPNEDEYFDQGGDEDAWIEMQALETVDTNLLEYLRRPSRREVQ